MANWQTKNISHKMSPFLFNYKKIIKKKSTGVKINKCQNPKLPGKNNPTPQWRK